MKLAILATAKRSSFFSLCH